MAASFLSSSELDNIKRQLKIDEGYKTEIYKDSLGYPTFGIGHWIISSDPEHGQPIGTKVSEERVLAVFETDVAHASADIISLFPKASGFPSEVKEILVNMVFNLGKVGLSKFLKFIAAVNGREWKKAGDEMMASKWYGQVGQRSKRLVERMKAVGGK